MLAFTVDSPPDFLAGLSEAIDGLQEEDFRLGFGTGLGPRLKALHRAINRLQAEAARPLQAYERRAVWLSETMDGVFVLNGTLDAEGGAILRAALAAVEGKPQAGDRRTAPQRRADAMVDLGRHRLDAGDLPTTGCQRPHLTVTADVEVLAGGAAGAGLLNWEQLVPAQMVRRLA